MKCTEAQLREECKKIKGKISKLYLHHTGGVYTTNEKEAEHYHITIEGDGSVHVHDIDKYKSHTFKRNTGALGISMCCGFGAIIYKDENILWGDYKPKPLQIINMAKVVTVLSEELNIPIDRLHVLTHNEVAVIDNYDIHSGKPDMRWDLRWLDDPGTHQTQQRGGDVVRGQALWYKKHKEEPLWNQ